MKMIVAAFALLFSGSAALAQHLPEKPEPRPEILMRQQQPGFWDLRQKVAFGTLMAAWSFDVAQTCHALANGGRETWMPTQSCGKLVVGGAALVAGTEALVYELHRHGHYKLARVLQGFAPVPNIVGIINSKRHKGW